jgi:hypothetical protein
MRGLSLLLMACLFTAAVIAAPLSPAAKAEVDGLLSRLEGSGCDFNRNGTWYPAAEVKPHLLRKLRYLEERGMVQSAEQFIELGASTSSMSGQAYLVKCAGGAPVPSASWLQSQLQLMRSAASTRKAP